MPVEPDADEEVLVRDANGPRSPLWIAVVLLVVVLGAYGTVLLVSALKPDHRTPSKGFNIFAQVRSACDEDDGNVVTTDTRGIPMAFATPDGPQRYWCVSKRYLASIGHGPEDPVPRLTRVPSDSKWRWPSTTYGR